MKRKILSISLLVFVVAVDLSAQTEKKSQLVGGTAGIIAYTRAGVGSATTIFLAPSYGSFVIDKLAIGTGLGFDIGFADGKYVGTFLGLSPFLRYFISNTYIFGHISYDLPPFAFLPERKVIVIEWSSLNVGAGYALFLKEYVSLEPILNYRIDFEEGKKSGSAFSLIVSLQIYFSKD